MWLILLALTWLVFIVNPFIGSIFVFLGLRHDQRNLVHYSAMFAFLFASLAYWFIPAHEMDLTRYFSQLLIYSGMSWRFFTSQVLSKSVLMIQELLFYAVAQTGNFHLLPALVVFVTYFITLYMINDYAYRHQIDSKTTLKVLVFTLCVLPFPVVVSNVRNILAFSIFVFATYRDLEQGKKGPLTVIAYIVPLFIHTSTLALVILRLLHRVYRTSKARRLINVGILLISFTITAVVNLLRSSFLAKNRLVWAFFTKADNYVRNTESSYARYLQTNLFSRLQKAYMILIALFLFVAWSWISKNRHNLRCDRIIGFHALLCLTVLGTAPIVLTVYMRFSLPVIMLSFVVLFQYPYLKKSYQKILMIGMVLGGLAGLASQIIFLWQLTDVYHMITSVMVRSLVNMFLM